MPGWSLGASRGGLPLVSTLRDKYTRTIGPARALAAETLKLERKPKAEV